MKLDALDHPKTHALTSYLGVSRPTVIGHLELLWAFTGKNAPQGDIGKWPDGAIASACEWHGAPELFIKALIDARFIDADAAHRLRVHDWQEHAPGWVRAKLKSMRKEFVVASTSKKRRSPRGSAPPETGSTPGTAPSIQGKCNAVKGSEALLGRAGGAGAEPEGAQGKRGEPVDTLPVMDRIKAAYPAGLHRGDHWTLAEREVWKLLDAGTAPEELVDAAAKYCAQQTALGKIGTESILRPSNFFNGSGAWRGPFPLPAAATPARSTSVTDRLTWRPTE